MSLCTPKQYNKTPFCTYDQMVRQQESVKIKTKFPEVNKS